MKGIVFALFVALLVVNAGALTTKLLGVTQKTYTGDLTNHQHDQNGYDDARNACQEQFPGVGARVCTEKDLGVFAQYDDIYLINNSDGVRFIDFSFGTHYDETTGRAERLDNCKGFTADHSNVRSRCIPRTLGGPLTVTTCPCSQQLSLICCVDTQ